MITIYHMDGDDLLLTHYCALQNAPVMKFEKSNKPGEIKFAFHGRDQLRSQGRHARPRRHHADQGRQHDRIILRHVLRTASRMETPAVFSNASSQNSRSERPRTRSKAAKSRSIVRGRFPQPEAPSSGHLTRKVKESRMPTISSPQAAATFYDVHTRRSFLRVGGLALGRTDVGRRASFAGRIRPGGQAPAEIDHHDLSQRRAVASRHVRHETAGPARVPRRVQPHQDQCAGHRDLRADADAGEDRGQVRDPPRLPAGELAHGQRVLQRLRLARIAARVASRRGPAPGPRFGREPTAPRRRGRSSLCEHAEPGGLGARLLSGRRTRAVPRGGRKRSRIARQHAPAAARQRRTA